MPIKRCPKCNSMNKPDADVCVECGEDIKDVKPIVE